MLTKCICTNCAGHLEFEEENAGEKIKCPHCGFETTLFLPGDEPETEESPGSAGLPARGARAGGGGGPRRRDGGGQSLRGRSARQRVRRGVSQRPQVEEILPNAQARAAAACGIDEQCCERREMFRARLDRIDPPPLTLG